MASYRWRLGICRIKKQLGSRIFGIETLTLREWQSSNGETLWKPGRMRGHQMKIAARLIHIFADLPAQQFN
jgi:hypothetical protein